METHDELGQPVEDEFHQIDVQLLQYCEENMAQRLQKKLMRIQQGHYVRGETKMNGRQVLKWWLSSLDHNKAMDKHNVMDVLRSAFSSRLFQCLASVYSMHCVVNHLGMACNNV